MVYMLCTYSNNRFYIGNNANKYRIKDSGIDTCVKKHTKNKKNNKSNNIDHVCLVLLLFFLVDGIDVNVVGLGFQFRAICVSAFILLSIRPIAIAAPCAAIPRKSPLIGFLKPWPLYQLRLKAAKVVPNTRK